MEDIDLELLPGIEEYLDTRLDLGKITCKDQEELKAIIRSRTGLDSDIIEIILSKIYHEIREKLISNENVYLDKVGKLKINKHKSIYIRPVEDVLSVLNNRKKISEKTLEKNRIKNESRRIRESNE